MSQHRDIQRDLNPHLFGAPAAKPETSTFAADPRVPASSVMGPPDEPARRVPYPPVDVRSMELQIANLKGALIQMEKRTDLIAFKMEELARTVHQRLERFSQSIVRVEDGQNKSYQEYAQRFASIGAKVNERKVSDSKMQELVDRHNMIVRNFENRMTSMQRLVSEQELALHNAQAALDEARSEITRLKR